MKIKVRYSGRISGPDCWVFVYRNFFNSVTYLFAQRPNGDVGLKSVTTRNQIPTFTAWGHRNAYAVEAHGYEKALSMASKLFARRNTPSSRRLMILRRFYAATFTRPVGLSARAAEELTDLETKRVTLAEVCAVCVEYRVCASLYSRKTNESKGNVTESGDWFLNATVSREHPL